MSQVIRLTQLDGAMPNLALMKLAHWHRARGDEVHVTRHIEPELFEPAYDRVYGSAIFEFSAARVERFRTQWPNAILGGTGTSDLRTVEDITGPYERYSYEGFDVDYSMGFTQRGCRLKCKFCKVPVKEGKNRSVNTIADIWRGAPWPKKLHLLDNDFFGQPRAEWEARIGEIVDGDFRVCLSQGINVRLIDDAAARALAQIKYRDAAFERSRLYTAWDNLGDEKVFFKGMDRLEAAGIPARNVMAYMLIGYAKGETWADIWRRFLRMRAAGIKPYPMVYDRSRTDLVCFQRWVNTGLYRIVEWPDYERETKSAESVTAYRQVAGSGPGRQCMTAAKPAVVEEVMYGT